MFISFLSAFISGFLLVKIISWIDSYKVHKRGVIISKGQTLPTMFKTGGDYFLIVLTELERKKIYVTSEMYLYYKEGDVILV